MPKPMIHLNSTYQPDCFYTQFERLPAAAQKRLIKAKPEVEQSSYTVWQYAGFIRAAVFVNGQWWDAEISMGDLSPEDWRPEGSEDDDTNDEAYAESILDELVACSDWDGMTVHLTRR